MTNLTPEQRILGRENADKAIGMTRRDWLIAASAAPTLAGFYFGYKNMGDKPPVKAAIIGTGDEGCQAMIRYHNRDYLNYIGYCDIRPSQQERAVKEFSDHKQYTAADVKKLKKYESKDQMLADPEVEVVVIALPLWLHAPVAIEGEGGSLVVEQAVADEAGLPYEGTFAWITLQVHSSLQAVGLTAAVSSALAEKGVPCNMLAGFYHDHILVPSDRVIDALAVLQNLSQR